MDKIWLKEGLDLRMVIFKCLSTGRDRGKYVSYVLFFFLEFSSVCTCCKGPGAGTLWSQPYHFPFVGKDVQTLSCQNEIRSGTSLVVQWLRFQASTAGGIGYIPRQGSSTCRTVWPKKGKSSQFKNSCWFYIVTQWVALINACMTISFIRWKSLYQARFLIRQQEPTISLD